MEENEKVIETAHSDNEQLTKETEYVTEDDVEVLGKDNFTPTIEIPSNFPKSEKEKSELSKEMTIRTGDAAKKLGVNRNKLIHLTRFFYEIIDVVQDPSNSYYQYTESSLKQLAFIINDMINSNRSKQQEKDFLLTELGGKVTNLAINNTKTLETLFSQMTESIIEANRQTISTEMGKQSNLLLENKDNVASTESKLDEIKALLSGQQNEEIAKLKSDVENERAAVLNSEKVILEKDKEIASLREELEQAKAELEKKNKKRFRLFIK